MHQKKGLHRSKIENANKWIEKRGSPGAKQNAGSRGRPQPRGVMQAAYLTQALVADYTVQTRNL